MIGGTSGYGMGETAIHTRQPGGVDEAMKKMTRRRIEIQMKAVRIGMMRKIAMVKRGP